MGMARALGRICLAATIAVACVAAGARRQAAPVPGWPAEHTGSAQQAVVGLRVVTTTDDGAVSITRTGAALVIRCDGFLLAPSELLSRTVTVAGRAEEGGKQSIEVGYGSGRPGERKALARTVAGGPVRTGWSLLRCVGAHWPALRPMLAPAASVPSDCEAVCAGGPEPRTVPINLKAAAARDEPGAPRWSATWDEGNAAPSIGDAVQTGEGHVVGLVCAIDAQLRSADIRDFEALGDATNCVTAAPIAEPTDADGPMVAVEGGLTSVPSEIAVQQPDLMGAATACLAPYRIDTHEVSNREYLRYWLALPAESRRSLAFRTRHRPLTWGSDAEPFPDEIADLPVLGVPLPGAQGYARAHGKRLPTPYEWCRAALGPSGPAQQPDWVRAYLRDRDAAWQKLCRAHEAYLRANPGLDRSLHPSPYALPWITRTPAAREAAQWSHDEAIRAFEALAQAWRDPLLTLPCGARGFDKSPEGAEDMILNAAELVAPPSWRPLNRRTIALQFGLEPARTQTFGPRPLDVGSSTGGLLPPMSRLYRRAMFGPTTDDLVMWSSLSDLLSNVGPVARLKLSVGWDYEADAVTLPTSRPGFQASLPDGYAVWRGPSRMRREMGHAVPLDSVDRRPSTGPQLYYYLPIGFRCAR